MNLVNYGYEDVVLSRIFGLNGLGVLRIGFAHESKFKWEVRCHLLKILGVLYGDYKKPNNFLAYLNIEFSKIFNGYPPLDSVIISFCWISPVFGCLDGSDLMGDLNLKNDYKKLVASTKGK